MQSARILFRTAFYTVACVYLLGMLILPAGCSGLKPVDSVFSVTFDQAWQAEREMRRHPKPLERPLVVIGGFADPDVSPPLYAGYFHDITGDRRIVQVSVGFCQSFASCRAAVIDAVDKAYPSNDPRWTTEVDVVGASLGGLVARFAASPSPDASHPRRLKIARLFSISSPQSGATLAQHIHLTQFHRDLEPGSDFQKRLAAYDATAGYELYPYVVLHDGIVGAQYAAPPGENPYWLPKPLLMPSHLEAMMDSRILADIARRLRGETPFTRPPAVPLPGATTKPVASRRAPSSDSGVGAAAAPQEKVEQ